MHYRGEQKKWASQVKILFGLYKESTSIKQCTFRNSNCCYSGLKNKLLQTHWYNTNSDRSERMMIRSSKDHDVNLGVIF